MKLTKQDTEFIEVSKSFYERLLKLREVAKILNKSTRTIYRYIEKGMPYYRQINGIYLFDVEEVLEWIERGEK